MPYIKTTQVDYSHLLFPKFNHNGEDISIEKPIIGDNKLSLASTYSLINFTILALDHSKAVKKGDTIIDKRMWNLSDLMHVSVRDLFMYSSLYKEYGTSKHGVVFAWLRDKISSRFSVNIRNITER